MIVYGDPQFEVPAHSFLRELQSRLETFPEDVDEVRAFLIRAGQLEQAASDALPECNPEYVCIVEHTRRITDLAAEAFLSAIGFGIPDHHKSQIIRAELENLKLPSDTQLTVKVPEGFEFYALCPEQYCASAKKWADTHADARPKRVAIVGIRSIGTTLSAVVAARLRLLGWESVRFTVRPHGHPFSRRVNLELDLGGIPFALVVDEGPGISGSSMAAAARALECAGVPEISFLPGHDGEPGAAASDETRQYWAQTPRYFTSLGELHWNGKSLHATLAEQSRRLCKTSEPFEIIEDLSGGNWRRVAFADEIEWPAVATQFERMKIRCSTRSGNSVLWKFCGHGCATGDKLDSAASALKKSRALAAQDFCPPALGVFRGFITMPWIHGQRLTRADAANPAVLRHMGRYLLHAAGPALSGEQSDAAVERLAHMLFWNTKDALGDKAAESIREWANAARETEIPLTYGDGHLAPHEWIRTESGILKTDYFGHDGDHTIIGKQSLLWDVAGTMVEWHLDEPTARPLLQPIEQSGIPVDLRALNFYCLAYAAFRMGLLRLATDQTADAAEKQRLDTAARFYRDHLADLLAKRPARLLMQTLAAPLPEDPLGACNPK